MKKLIVLLAAHGIYNKGQQLELENGEADRLIAEGKAIEVVVDKSLKNRDHATDAAQEDLIAAAVAKAIKGMTPAPAAAEPVIPRVKASSNFDRAAAENERQAAGSVEVGDDFEAKSAKEEKGLNWARYVKALGVAKLDGTPVEDVLEGWGYKALRTKHLRQKEVRKQMGAQLRALGQNTIAGGGALVPDEYSAELIPLLRNVAVVRKMGARSVPMGASLTMPKQTGAGTAYYVEENQPVTPSEPTFGNLTLTEKKLMILVPFSNDLIRNADIDAERMIRDDAVQVMALKEDISFLFGNGTQSTPRGLDSLIDAANVYSATAVDPKNPTLAEIRRELAKLVGRLRAGNIPMINPGFIMSPRTAEYLEGVTDGNGNAIFADALGQGRLRTFPFLVTNQIPENLDGTSDASRLFFGDFAQAMIGESKDIEVEMFPNGAYESGGTVLSGISRDQTVLRGIAKHDFALRYAKAFVELKLRWGAP